MFCPKCGQQQIADYTKFCSRCGLAISGLGDYVAGSAVPTVRPNPKTLAVNSPKSKAIRRGVKVMFFSGVLSPLFFGLCFLVDNPGPLLAPLSIFLTGLSLMLYAQLFGDDQSLATSQQIHASQPGAISDAAPLPPAPNLRLNSSGRQQGRTAEMAPPSVTEHTTRLLDGDES